MDRATPVYWNPLSGRSNATKALAPRHHRDDRDGSPVNADSIRGTVIDADFLKRRRADSLQKLRHLPSAWRDGSDVADDV
jgi:hypothetical protein